MIPSGNQTTKVANSGPTTNQTVPINIQESCVKVVSMKRLKILVDQKN